MLGSSRIYMDPVRLLPNAVDRLIRWDSPPDRVEERRLRVRYPSPTSANTSSLLFISFSNLRATFFSNSDNFREQKNSLRLLIGSRTISVIDFPPIFT